jgi:hypothetical protein
MLFDRGLWIPPLCSGAGLHVGHPEGYTATDIIARYKRMRGFNVLHPMGWDAFGLPAEQYAIQTGTHPAFTTQLNIDRFRTQLRSLGFSYDWRREVSTCDPEYYRWTQWIFLKLLQRGLAYQAEVPVNWCPALGTVLANEEIIDGKVGSFRYGCFVLPCWLCPFLSVDSEEKRLAFFFSPQGHLTFSFVPNAPPCLLIKSSSFPKLPDSPLSLENQINKIQAQCASKLMCRASEVDTRSSACP